MLPSARRASAAASAAGEIGPVAPQRFRDQRLRQGRSASRRQRERMVGSSRPGLSLTRSSTARSGGSSRIFSSALAALRFIASAPSRTTTRQPPSAGVRRRKPAMAAGVVDDDLAALSRLRLRIDSRARPPGGRDGRPRRRGETPDAPARRRARSAARREEPAASRRALGEEKAGEAKGQRRLADAARPGDQPGMRQPAARIGAEQRRFGRLMAR